MSDNKLISVLMPVYKPNLAFLRTAVESILNQTYQNFELLILYEGDKQDDAYQYLGKVVDRRLKIIVLPQKSGLPRSLNTGLAAAKGEYIARMDADDYSEKRRFEKQLNYMERHTDVAVLGCVCRVMDSKRLMFSNQIPPEVRRVRMLFGNAGVAHPTAFIRKCFLDEKGIKYNEEISGSEDYHLWVDVTVADGKIDTLGEILLRYRVHGGQASKFYKEEMVGWDGMARKKLLTMYGDFTEGETSSFLKFTSCRGEEIDVEESFGVLKKMKSSSINMSPNDYEVLQKEVVYQWVRKGISLWMCLRDRRMLQKTYIRGVWTKGSLWYLLKEFIREVVGKVIPRMKYGL